MAAAAFCGTLGAWCERPGVVRAYFAGAEHAAGGDASTRHGERIEDAFAAAWRAVAGTSPPRAQARRVDPVDWLARWRDAARPVEAAPALWIAPPGAALPAAARAPDATVVVILPGQGFGTGTHPTTRALLGWLVREPAHGDVLDVGAGSGILALAALALGARRAVALEIDPAAVENAATNRALNAAGWRGAPIGARLALVQGSLDAVRPDAVFERVVANLDRPTLERLLPALARRVAPGGRLGVAGILDGEEAPIVALARSHGLALADHAVEGDPSGAGGWWSGWLAPILSPS